MKTTYNYDVLDHLLSVQQNGISGQSTPRSRTFTYDTGLSRLITSQNSESGTTCYGKWSGGTCQNGYDLNGNLVYKTDARNVTISSLYDNLNRLIQRSASDSSFVYSNAYDIVNANQSNGIGRLGHSSNNVNGAANYSYDTVGRIVNRYVCVPGNCTYTLGAWASYDLAGNLTTSALADGIQVNATYDAAGRLNAATAKINNSPVPVISNAIYGAVGLTKATLGNGLSENFGYDNRLRLYSYSVGTNSTTKYSYGLTFYPNGNLKSSSDTVNGSWSYTYDSLNRLLTGSSANTAVNWTYDPFGNRKTQTATLGYAPQTVFTFNSPTNRIDAYCYDASGNVLDEGPCPQGSIHQFTYDGEGKLVSSQSGAVTYTYDGDGKRIAKSSGGAVTNVYFYDVNGNRVVDTDGAISVLRTEIFAGGRHRVSFSNSGNTFNHPNWLGTESARTDYGGSVCETLSGLPFGDALMTSGTCSPSPDFFTGKERDAESGLDYFGARYLSSSMGRFMSPDWSATPAAIPFADPADPQSLNQYSYVKNNPLNRTDPNGHNWFDVNGKWSWHEGDTWKDGKNTYTSKYTGLLVATQTGTDKKTGATTYSLTLYDQNKAVATGTGFSGGEGHPAVRDGNYMIRLDIRDPNGPNTINPNSALGNPPQFYGIQAMHDIDDGQYRYGVVGAYGPMRARLNPTGGAKDDGDYFHGQTNGHGWTHGCLCYGADTRFINYMWNNMPHVPMPVSIDTPVQKP
jgi:RHS repeat-associated protein